MLFRGMDRAALDAAYNNTAAVGIPKRDEYVGGWAARSDALRKTREAKADLRYGDAPRQRPGGIAISGIYDLEPVRLNYLNDKLRLDEAEATRNSPIRHLPSHAAPLVVAVGLGELPELIRQSEEYWAAWQAKGLRGQYLPLPGHDHFSILEELARSS